MSIDATLPQRTPTAAMIRTLGLVAAICGVIIVAAYQGTFEAAQENRRLAVERAVFKVIPAAAAIDEYAVAADGTLAKVGAGGTVAGNGAIKFYAGYDKDGRLAGIAAEGAAKGYADTVRILWAWDPARQEIAGFGVTFSRETPGIGDKILAPEFRANFPLSATLADDGRGLANAIRTVKHGSKTNPWEIDAVAGATITSRAVGRAIGDGAQALLPRIAPHLDRIGERQ